MSNSVIHFQIGGRDAATLKRFYQDVLGWEVDEPAPIGAIRTGTGAGIDGGSIRWMRTRGPTWRSMWR